MRLQGVLELDSGGLEQQWPQDAWAFTKQLPSLTELLDRQSAGDSLPSTGKGDWSCKEIWQEQKRNPVADFFWYQETIWSSCIRALRSAVQMERRPCWRRMACRHASSRYYFLTSHA